ncbi:uncharacterized protein LOC129988250 [Argiope bruennichi]|uniref:Uncharacterized protein n=1 Tax=Argiope bruennichi TaxID=94029 RepID=A0A8T0EDK1_ARGBR|nr:uncharacterized protein LOC129988250 [Argiope bruennichi]KAF8770859.1 hypothetical protein HNY73_018341 [Argiope bruennichi]
MLRALASYFFGGIEDETPEAPIECETREVNDWLVVNLPDQNKDSINLNDDDDDEDTYEIDDEDIKNVMDDDDDAIEVDASDLNEMDSDEDDILLSLSFLMMPPDAENLSSELSNDQSSFENRVLKKSHYQGPFVPLNRRHQAYFEENVNYSSIVLVSSKLLEAVGRSLKYFEDIQKLEGKPAIQKNELLEEDVLDLFSIATRQRTKRNDIVNEFERKDKVNVQVLEISSPPMYSKNYVNHRHPEKVLNYDLLQRIQELEPEQQAVQRSIRKNLTRGQLNRQNKNYMYETSSKKNRRSNRQRNPSGANNNRKC